MRKYDTYWSGMRLEMRYVTSIIQVFNKRAVEES